MRYIEPHAHMVSRTTDDYQKMAIAGCVALCEPAFWAGYDRSSAAGFSDYFHQLTNSEPQRAAQFGIAHYTWLCINPKESENIALAREVIDIIPQFLHNKNVLGIGEIGLNKNTKNEITILQEHIALAKKYQLPILIHTPHLEDKLKGTRLIIELLQEQQFDPSHVLIDHAEEHTIAMITDAGFWAGITLYPQSKCTFSRAIDMLEMYQQHNIWINSACDWGVSDPLSVPKCILEMRRRKFSIAQIDDIVFQKPSHFLSQSPNFQLPASTAPTS